MIYVEYVSRLPGVPLDRFHAVMLEAQARWDAGHGEDALLWGGARTWRLGPEPEYVVVWHSPGLRLERIDDWDRIFRAGEAERHAETVGQVSRIDRAGCYAALRDPAPARGGTYYLEHFRATDTLPAVRALYETRARRHAGFTLNLLAHRIGHLAPDPGGIALWTIPSFAALGEIAAELDDRHDPVELIDAGTYADIGHEIL